MRSFEPGVISQLQGRMFGFLPAKRRSTAAWLAAVFIIFAALIDAPALRPVRADERRGDKLKAETSAAKPVAAIRTAERNVQTPAGHFRVLLRQSPADPRANEEVQFAVDLSEQVEGGFAGSDRQPLEGATVTARATAAAGQLIADKLESHAEGASSYGSSSSYEVHYAFSSQGNYKIIFDARMSDGRQFSADFPVTIVAAPVNWLFWLGLAVLALFSVGGVYGYHRSWTQEGTPGRLAARKTLPIAAGALLFLGLSTAALAYFTGPRERRATADLPLAGTEVQTAGETPATTTAAAGDAALGGSGAVLTIAKESQLLFRIRTAPIEERQIISGLTTTGAVRARPTARAVISPPVSGRITFNRNIAVGTVVGRNQTIGSVEQVLGAPEQADLENRRIELRTAALEQQSQVAQQRAQAQQAQTRLAQAQRELQRATNLLEVNAAPRRRVEEAQTAVQLAEQEIVSAEHQARAAEQQAQFAQTSVARVNPIRTFPLISPVTGTITNLNVTTGQQVEAGVELMSIINLTTVFLEAQVFERDLAAVRDSGRATYTAPGLNGEVYRIGQGGEGRLVLIGQSVDPQTRTVPVIFEVPNPLNRLREGMFVEITLDTSGGNKVLTVPKQSVITEQGRTFVFVFDGGEQFERRVVVLAAEGQDYYEVRSGVQAGERVVTEGIYQLRSTQPGA